MPGPTSASASDASSQPTWSAAMLFPLLLISDKLEDKGRRGCLHALLVTEVAFYDSAASFHEHISTDSFEDPVETA